MKKTSHLISVVLKERLRGRGLPGDVVSVKRGYALNFLIPEGRAVMATKPNLEMLEQKRNDWLSIDEKRKAEGKAIKDQIDKITIDIEHNTVDGFRLYGSISSKEIIMQLADKGFAIKKEDIVMKPIKEIGSFTAQIHTYGNQSNITINVKSPEVIE
ncbi:50S ribosomal protein L9 [Candidatus Cytomitobacter primus]|uniref:Large ribosomal subunit protein bL9 n=1 Tax=Candidatus Cytomitobacter primus TaxID=2066024 RepID=A0A5C0UHA9_9PROT|nr:50S ribosomal protein L9 [Candidatus Cytomitobacter primus]QEK38702.1 50S ribosomal protein L9 [Candidatus Cytomitobacter primus]